MIAADLPIFRSFVSGEHPHLGIIIQNLEHLQKSILRHVGEWVSDLEKFHEAAQHSLLFENGVVEIGSITNFSSILLAHLG